MAATDSAPNNFGTKVAVWTASLVALAGLIDAATAVFTKTESIACSVGLTLPWCTPHPQAGSRTIADFAGDWRNENPKGGVARVSIEQRLDRAIVHAWGTCVPTDCDLGTAETPASAANTGTLRVEWNSKFEIIDATLMIGEGNRLEFRKQTHFTDNSGRPDYESVDYLVRH